MEKTTLTIDSTFDAIVFLLESFFFSSSDSFDVCSISERNIITCHRDERLISNNGTNSKDVNRKSVAPIGS